MLKISPFLLLQSSQNNFFHASTNASTAISTLFRFIQKKYMGFLSKPIKKCHSSEVTSIKTTYSYPGYPGYHPAQAPTTRSSLRGTLGRFRIIYWDGSRPFQVHVDGPQIPQPPGKDVEDLRFLSPEIWKKCCLFITRNMVIWSDKVIFLNGIWMAISITNRICAVVKTWYMVYGHPSHFWLFNFNLY